MTPVQGPGRRGRQAPTRFSRRRGTSSGLAGSLSQASLIESLFTTAPIGLQIFAPDGTALRMNEANRRLLDRPSLNASASIDNLLTDPISIAGGGDSAFRRALAGETVQLSQQLVPQELATTSSNTYDYWLFPICNPRGAVVAVVAALIDVTGYVTAEAELQTLNARLEALAAMRTAQLRATVAELESEVYERRQAEASQRASDERFRAVVEAGLDGFIMLECVRDEAGTAVDMRIVELNQRMELILRRSRSELLGRHLRADLPDSPGSLFTPLYLEVATTGRPVQRPVDVPAGRPSAGQYEMQVIKLGDGVAVSLRDLAARHAAEEDRLRLERQLQETQRLEGIGLLAGGIAHDFNNILTSVLGNAELAAQEVPPGSPAAASLVAVIEGMGRIAELTSQLLAYAGRGRLVVELVVINQLIEELRDLLAATLPEGCLLHLDLAAGLPPVNADRGQIRQLVHNLVANAVESFSPHGGRVSVSTASTNLQQAVLAGLQLGADLAAGSYVELTVTDHGEGMNGETLAHAFRPFFSTRGPGRGLGLAAVQGIVRAHGGALLVESEPGRGTTVRVWLPAAAGARPGDA